MTQPIDVYEEYFLDGSHPVAELIDEPTAEWASAYAPLAEQGIGLSVGNPTSRKRSISLRALRPVIELITNIQIATIDEVSDLEVLEHASSLERLSLHCSTRAVVDLSQLPKLSEYQGKLTRGTASVLPNPSLRRLEIVGRAPKITPTVEGEIEKFRHIGPGRSLPNFAYPDSVTSIERAGPTTFDLDLLNQFPALEMFRLERCPEVFHVQALNSLASLRRVIFQECKTPESWEELSIDHVLLHKVTPPLTHPFALAAFSRGWVVDLKLDEEGNIAP